jgi:hypothetical protein
MGHDSSMIALDSNAMTYWIEAMGSVTTAPTAPEKVALVRVFLWMPDETCFHYTPTVEAEYRAIRDRAKRNEHLSWALAHVSCLRPLPAPTRLAARAADLGQYHKGNADCSIVAECELMEVITLLTCDTNLLKNLRTKSSVRLCLPSDYWALMDVPKGMWPVRKPHYTNPLSKCSWWHW